MKHGIEITIAQKPNIKGWWWRVLTADADWSGIAPTANEAWERAGAKAEELGARVWQ